jgi:hypothetical protein
LNASLIFASHNANFLNQLQKENIIFVEKDKDANKPFVEFK